MLIPTSRRWVLGLALLELGLARPYLAQADETDPGPVAAPPAAQPPAAQKPLELSWVSPDPSCDGTTVAARALELVAPGITPRPTEARATLGRDGSSWIVDLQTRSESHVGHRVLRGESCREIQQAISLLLAMILESEAKSVANPSLAPPLPAPPPVAPPVSTAPNTMLTAVGDDEPPPTRTPAASLGWLVRGDAIAALGLKPGLGLGAGVGAGLSLGGWELAAGVTYWPTSRTEIFDGTGTLEVSRENLAVSGCYRFSTGTLLQIVPCVGPELTWFRWRSEGIDEGAEGRTERLVSLTGSIEFRFEIVGPLFAAVTPGVTWELSQPFGAKKDCEDCTPTDVFHTWGIGPRLGAGVGARF